MVKEYDMAYRAMWKETLSKKHNSIWSDASNETEVMNSVADEGEACMVYSLTWHIYIYL